VFLAYWGDDPKLYQGGITLMNPQRRTGFFPELLGEMSTVDLESLPGPDPVAFATGYLMGKRGLSKDPLAEELGVVSYNEGWQLGVGVREGLMMKPSWDKS